MGCIALPQNDPSLAVHQGKHTRADISGNFLFFWGRMQKCFFEWRIIFEWLQLECLECTGVGEGLCMCVGGGGSMTLRHSTLVRCI